jgi:hypothetical protein
MFLTNNKHQMSTLQRTSVPFAFLHRIVLQVSTLKKMKIFKTKNLLIRQVCRSILESLLNKHNET